MLKTVDHQKAYMPIATYGAFWVHRLYRCKLNTRDNSVWQFVHQRSGKY